MTRPDPESDDRPPSEAEELFGDFLARREAGEEVSIEEYCQRHPEAAEELRRTHGELLGLFEELEQIGEEWHASGEPGSGSELPVALGPMTSLTARVLERLSGRRSVASRYRIDEEVARGGMGSILRVWDEDLRRLLAMKVILEPSSQDPMRREQRLARFLEEAQITGQLDHPGIVPVHELGVDSEGRVFFTMKMVQGRTLKQVIEQAHAGKDEKWTRTRLIEIVLKICEAMAYSHAKRVIHRDLKPANVMVGRFGEVYVMDWGLARLMGRADTKDVRLRVDATQASQILRTDRMDAEDSGSNSPLYTMDGDVVGTPAYMSPEQARGDSARVGSSSDIYSVGAILYHALSGCMPYVPPGTEPSNRDVWRRVRVEAPEPLLELDPDLPGELVALCNKAMAREPEQRYPDMQALASDLRAFMEGRVVRAYQSGAVAELKKWVRRNRGLAAALLGILITMVGGLAATSWVQARERDVADREAAKATAALEFLRSMLAAANPNELGPEVTVGAVLDEAAARLENYEGPPEVASLLHDTIGMTYENLGRLEQAVAHSRRGVDMAEHLLPVGHVDSLRAQANLGTALTRSGQLDEAEEVLRKALELARQHLDPKHMGTLVLMDQLVVNLLAQGRYGEADTLSRDALTGHREVLGDDHPRTLAAMGNRARVVNGAGKRDEAEALFQECWERSRARFGWEKPRALIAGLNWALFLRRAGRHVEAEPLARKIAEQMRAGLGEDHPDTLVAQSSLALILADTAHYQESETLFRKTLRSQEELLGPDHEDVIVTMGNLALVLTETGKLEEAEGLHWEMVERSTSSLGEDHPHTLGSRQNLGRFLSTIGRTEDALGILDESLAAKRRAHGDDHPSTLSGMRELARAQHKAGNVEQGVALFAATVVKMESTLGPGHRDTLMTRAEYANALAATGDLQAAEEHLRKILAEQETRLGAESPAAQATRKTLQDLAEARQQLEAPAKD